MAGIKVDFQWVRECDGGAELTDEVLTGKLDDIKGKLILLPTERMVQEAKLRIAEKGGGFTGCIMTPRRLPRYLYDLLSGSDPVIDLTTREMMILNIMKGENLRSLVRKGDVRSGMVQKISRTIGELIQQDVSYSQLQKITRTGRSRELGLIYQKYIVKLRENKMVDPDLLAREVISLLKGATIRFSSIAYYLPGEMSELQRTLIGELMCITDEFIIREHACRAPPSFLEKISIGERPSFHPLIPLTGEKALPTIRMEGSAPSLSGMDALDEIRNIIRDIKRRCIIDGIDPSSFRIVFPVRQSFDDLVRIAANEYEVPIDQGEDLPLEKVPVITAILTLLRAGGEGLKRKRIIEAMTSPFLVLEDEEGNSISGLDLEIITRTASMGPLRRSAEEWSLILEKLAGDPLAADHVKETASRAVFPLVGLLKRLERLGNERGTVPEMTGEIIDILSHLNVHENIETVVSEGEKISGAEQGEGPFQFNVTALYKFYKALRSIERRSRILGLGRIMFPDLLRDIEIEISKENIRSAPRVSGIQIMGLTEAAGLSMSNVYFAGLVEGILPSVENGFRIMTQGEMQDAGMIDPDTRRNQLESLAIAIGSTTNPVLSYHMNTNERPVPISSFIEDIKLDPIQIDTDPRSRVELHRILGELIDPASIQYSRKGQDMTYTIPDLLFHSGTEAKRLERGLRSYRNRKDSESNEFSGRIVDEDLISIIRDRYDHDHIWSVTQFETFRNCPYHFFVRYILRIQELEDLEPGIPPEKKGLIFHEVVERFYNEFRRKHSERVTRENLSSAIKLIRSIAFEVIDQHPNKGPYWDALKDQFIGNEGEKGLLDCFLEMEADYEGPFIVEGTEIKFGMSEGSPPVRISLPGDEGGPDSFNLRGSIDRLDTIKAREGDLDFIWDYKTGRSDVDKESVQVPLYLAAIRKMFPDHYPAGGGYYYVRKRGSITRNPVHGEDIWSGEVRSNEDLQSHITSIGEDIHNSIQRCLEMIDTIRSGDLSPQPKCRERFCKFPHICRRGDT